MSKNKRRQSPKRSNRYVGSPTNRVPHLRASASTLADKKVELLQVASTNYPVEKLPRKYSNSLTHNKNPLATSQISFVPIEIKKAERISPIGISPSIIDTQNESVEVHREVEETHYSTYVKMEKEKKPWSYERAVEYLAQMVQHQAGEREVNIFQTVPKGSFEIVKDKAKSLLICRLKEHCVNIEQQLCQLRFSKNENELVVGKSRESIHNQLFEMLIEETNEAIEKLLSSHKRYLKKKWALHLCRCGRKKIKVKEEANQSDEKEPYNQMEYSILPFQQSEYSPKSYKHIRNSSASPDPIDSVSQVYEQSTVDDPFYENCSVLKSPEIIPYDVCYNDISLPDFELLPVEAHSVLTEVIETSIECPMVEESMYHADENVTLHSEDLSKNEAKVLSLAMESHTSPELSSPVSEGQLAQNGEEVNQPSPLDDPSPLAPDVEASSVVTTRDEILLPQLNDLPLSKAIDELPVASPAMQAEVESKIGAEAYEGIVPLNAALTSAVSEEMPKVATQSPINAGIQTDDVPASNNNNDEPSFPQQKLPPVPPIRIPHSSGRFSLSLSPTSSGNHFEKQSWNFNDKRIQKVKIPLAEIDPELTFFDLEIAQGKEVGVAVNGYPSSDEEPSECREPQQRQPILINNQAGKIEKRNETWKVNCTLRDYLYQKVESSVPKSYSLVKPLSRRLEDNKSSEEDTENNNSQLLFQKQPNVSVNTPLKNIERTRRETRIRQRQENEQEQNDEMIITVKISSPSRVETIKKAPPPFSPSPPLSPYRKRKELPFKSDGTNASSPLNERDRLTSILNTTKLHNRSEKERKAVLSAVEFLLNTSKS